MAVAKTKETPEDKSAVPDTTTTSEETTVKKSDLVEAVKDILKDLLPGKGSEPEEPQTEGIITAKRMSARDEEEHTRSIVADAIAEFKKALPGGDDTPTAKVETETVPGATHIRKVQGFMWGKE